MGGVGRRCCAPAAYLVDDEIFVKSTKQPARVAVSTIALLGGGSRSAVSMHYD